MRRDINIQIIRILAMLSIVICHIVQETNNKYLVMSAQFFNIGVYIFLIISGYLYSEKNIEVKSFYKKKIFKNYIANVYFYDSNIHFTNYR